MGAGDEGGGFASPELPDPEPANDRRRFLIKAGAAGAAAWVTPMVLSSPALAAQSGSPPTNPPPPCISCNSANVVNGSFEQLLSDWDTHGTVLLLQYSGFITDPPPEAGANFAAMVDPSIVGIEGSPGTLEQRLTIDQACTGRPFTLSFLSGVFAPVNGEVPLYQVQFLGPGGNVGAPFTLSPPQMDDPLHFIPQSISGTVPDGATSVLLSFFGSDSAVDLVDFTICS
jgi:hypothetical protein